MKKIIRITGMSLAAALLIIGMTFSIPVFADSVLYGSDTESGAAEIKPGVTYTLNTGSNVDEDTGDVSTYYKVSTGKYDAEYTVTAQTKTDASDEIVVDLYGEDSDVAEALIPANNRGIFTSEDDVYSLVLNSDATYYLKISTEEDSQNHNVLVTLTAKKLVPLKEKIYSTAVGKSSIKIWYGYIYDSVNENKYAEGDTAYRQIGYRTGKKSWKYVSTNDDMHKTIKGLKRKTKYQIKIRGVYKNTSGVLTYGAWSKTVTRTTK
jgi:hypothetical protein